MNEVHIYLTVCVCLLVYLSIANIMYVFFKFNSLRKQHDKIRCVKVFSELTRTLYLTSGGALIVWNFSVQNTSLNGYIPLITKCGNYKYISMLMQIEATQISRLFCAFSQLYSTKKMMGKRFGTKTSILLGILLCSTCAIIVLTDTTVEVTRAEYRGHPVCVLPFELSIWVMWVCITTVLEVVMLSLYIYPLWKLDLGRGRSASVCTYNRFQKDDSESLLGGEDTYHGVSLSNSKEKEDSVNVEDDTRDLLSRYHRAVLRNFYSGIVGIIVFLQYMIVCLVFLSMPAHLRNYWFSGTGLIHYTLTFFMIYICIALNDRDWLLVLFPFKCKKPKCESTRLIEVGPIGGQESNALENDTAIGGLEQ